MIFSNNSDLRARKSQLFDLSNSDLSTSNVDIPDTSNCDLGASNGHVSDSSNLGLLATNHTFFLIANFRISGFGASLEHGASSVS